VTGTGRINVVVVYAAPGVQVLREVELQAGATIGAAIEVSRLVEACPGLDPGGRNRVGIFGTPGTMQTPLSDGDRVEIYRPLTVDPKEARRLRAQKRAAGGISRRKPG
jgi:putative ubiquitin-RnfH superfamily antitoxin RatB of RatAB toxin-antitoxin module